MKIMSEEKKTEATEEKVAEEVKTDKTDKTEKTEKKKVKKDKNKEKIEELETASEKLGIYDDATAKAVEELLPVADSITMAMQNTQDAPEEFRKGIELVGNQLKTSFEKLKVEAFCEAGDEFDPNLHNAVSKIESDEYEENQITAVFQKGYKLGDKIIRHAMVQVCG